MTLLPQFSREAVRSASRLNSFMLALVSIGNLPVSVLNAVLETGKPYALP